MRTLSAAAQTKFDTKLGIEPQFIVEIQWTEGGSVFSYADVEITEGLVTIPGVLNSVSGLDNVIVISGVQAGTTSDSQQISIVINDSSGDIKRILDQNDIHKRPVTVFQWAEGLALVDKFELFRGQVSSPLEWNKGDQTVTFDVINRIEDAEVGFSIEEGDFVGVPTALIGKAWPLLFGRNIHIPALQVINVSRAILLQQFVIADFTLVPRLEQLKRLCCPLVFLGFKISGIPGITQKAVSIFSPEPSCFCRRIAEIEALEAEIARQAALEVATTTITMQDGEIMPQGERITLEVNGALITGQFQGTDVVPSDTFVIESRVHPKVGEFSIPPIIDFCSALAKSTGVLSNGAPTYQSRPKNPFSSVRCGTQTNTDSVQLGWDYLSEFPRAGLFNAETGSEVFLDEEGGTVHVVNLLPSTILRVAAFRTFHSGVRVLSTVPSDAFTTRVSDFNGYMVQELLFPTPLTRLGQGWEEQIYVSSDSSVGPNPVDIIQFLIEKYTNFPVDAANFADIKAKLDVYDNAVPLLERRNVLEVLQDLAFGNRCAIILRNNVFKLIYLSELPSADFTIDEGDIVPGSLTITHTDTDELVTKMQAQWQDDHAFDPKRYIARYNVQKYGIHPEDFDFFMFNIFKWVEKSTTFWMIRMANTWRKLRFTAYLTKLDAEVFDVAAVTLPDFTPGTINCIVEKATYDSTNQRIEFELWTPVRSGEQAPFDFAFPANISTTLLWPTVSDITDGTAGGFGVNRAVKPPTLHPLFVKKGIQSINYNESSACTNFGRAGVDGRPDFGDCAPTDEDDEKETKKVKGEGESGATSTTKREQDPLGDFTSRATFEQRALLQDQNRASAEEAKELDESNETREENEDITDPTECQDTLDKLPDDTQQNCTVTLRVCWIVPVTAVFVAEGVISKEDGAQGQAVQNVKEGSCEFFTYDSLEAGKAAEAKFILESLTTATVGENKVATSPIRLDTTNWVAGCEEPEDPGLVAYNREEDSPGSGNEGVMC